MPPSQKARHNPSRDKSGKSGKSGDTPGRVTSSMRSSRTSTSSTRSRSTSTSSFGVSKRESHDASGFYDRFTMPSISNDSEINRTGLFNKLFCGDSREMSQIADKSVGFVVTSPPYFAAKEYEAQLGVQGVPSSYIEYLSMLHDVFKECHRVLEPGGRIAINVANLGRKPFRSLSADVIRILADDLGFLLRGEIVWVKGEGASGNCAWGSYASSANPTLRDVSERIIVASKDRFDRALTRSERAKLGLPNQTTILADEFRELTLDVWRFQPASARKIGHPAPFPIELPRRLIELFTYEEDVVLDPFVGSGQTCLAALECNRYFLGFDLVDEYVELAQARVNEYLQATRANRGDRDLPISNLAPTERGRPPRHKKDRDLRVSPA